MSLWRRLKGEYDSPNKGKLFGIQVDERQENLIFFYIFRGRESCYIDEIDLCLVSGIKDSIQETIEYKIKSFLNIKSFQMSCQQDSAYVEIVLQEPWTQEQKGEVKKIIQQVVSEEVIRYEACHGVKRVAFSY